MLFESVVVLSRVLDLDVDTVDDFVKLGDCSVELEGELDLELVLERDLILGEEELGDLSRVEEDLEVEGEDDFEESLLDCDFASEVDLDFVFDFVLELDLSDLVLSSVDFSLGDFSDLVAFSDFSS